MFEKEAEEAIMKKYPSNITGYKNHIIDWKEGAEFGYNQANEWHNIKENPNDLPNDGELVVADNGLAIECVKFRKDEFGNSWRHDRFELGGVIYWKKLVLSKDRNK